MNNKIDSFKVDHTKLKRGIYISRVDNVGGSGVVTYDIRVCEPAKKEYMDPKVAHTIEHIGATFFRTKSKFKDNVVYFGPMGCMTGFYLILSGYKKTDEVWNEVQEMFSQIAAGEWKEIPGATEIECGNAGFHDLAGAIEFSKEYSEFLSQGPNPKNMLYVMNGIY